MAKKFILAAAAASLFAIPGAASAQYYPGYGYNNGYQRGYDNYNRSYSGRGYYGQNYYGNRCSGTTGTIVGGVAGALLGREVDRGGNSRYGRRDSGTTGAIIGGALGALAGRGIDKSSCDNRYYR